MTPRKSSTKSKENIALNEQTFRLMFEQHSAVILLIEPQTGEILNANQAAVIFYGYSKSKLCGMLIHEINTLSPEQVAVARQKAVNEEQDHFVFLHKLAGGEERTVEVYSSPIVLQEKQVLFSIIHDITGHHQAKEALRESEKLLSESQSIAAMGSYSLDFTTGLWKSSDILDRIFGIDAAYIRSVAGWGDLIHPDHRQQMDDYFTHEVMGRRIRFDREYKIIRKDDGAVRWVHGMGQLEVDAQNNLLKMRGVIQDITERKQAEDEMRQRVMELETLYESGLEINQLLSQKEIGQKLIEILEQKLGWHHTTVRLYHPQNESLELLAFNQPGLKSEAEWHKVEELFKTLIASATQGLSGWVAQHGQLIRSNDLLNNLHYVDTYPGLQSGLYVPIKLGERVIGVISIESEQHNAFSVADERLTSTLANQAASALENARLFEAERKQRQVSDALRDSLSAGASMSVSLDFETILDRLLEALERVVPFEGGSIMFVQPEKQKINIARIRGYKKQGKSVLEDIIKFGFNIATVENLRWIFNNKQPLIISDVEQYPGWIRTQESSFIRSWAGAPIIVNDEVIAFFSLDSTEPNFFTHEHAELLRAFTGQASLALQNARLFEQTKRRFQEFAALYETSNALSTENDLNPMLQVIVEHAKKLLGTASSGMYLYIEESDELVLTTVDTASRLDLGVHLQMGEGAAGHVAKTRQPLRMDDYSTWDGRSLQYEGSHIRAVLEVPMLYGGELIGVLTVDEIGDSDRKFTEGDERLLSLFASQAAGAIHSAHLRQQTTRHLNQLQALHLIDRAISSTFDLRLILNTVITQTITQLNVDAADILLFHPALQTLEYIAGQGFRTRAIEQTQLRLGEDHAGRAAFERGTIHIPNLPATGSKFTRTALLNGENFLDYYAVPLTAKGKVKGVLEVFNRTALPLNLEWLDFLENLAGQAAITIDQTQLFDDLQRANFELITAYDATIEGWARAMELRDKETENHTRRVTEMTTLLAKALNIKDSEILHIRRGALLHDIGKIGVPDNILLKEGKLTEEEWVLMRQHPQFAYEMLQPIKYLRQSLDIPYCHHERWDGTGYPRKLKGEQIPFAARIFAIIDVWDAVTIDRPYRKGWTKTKALAHIKAQNGKHFEPRVVDAFLEIFASEKD
jgi:PAS domain S-box-containing protein